MQRSDDSPTGGRPSLLSPGQQTEADRNRILSTLESGPAGTGKAPMPTRRFVWWAAAAAVLLILLGALLWFFAGTGSDMKARPAPVEPTASAAALAAATPAPPQSAAATIHEEAPPAAASARASTASPAEKESLVDMLRGPTDAAVPAVPAGSAPKGDMEALIKKLDRPEHVHVNEPKHKAGAPVQPKSRAKQNAEPEADSDATLLAAMIAHQKGEAIPGAPYPASRAEIKACRQPAGQDVDACISRVCAGRWKTDTECQAVEKANTQKAAVK